MIKEIVLAITLGALLGFGITGGYLASQKGHQKTTVIPVPTLATSISPSITNSPIPTDQPNVDSTIPTLSIVTPKNEDIVTNSLIELEGTTTINSLVVINTNLKQYQTTANDNGEFKVEIELETGSNNILIDSFDAQDVQSSISLQVTYSTAKI